MPIYIIEHLEPRIWEWCLIEYENISNIVEKENLWITNVKRKNKKLEKFAKIFKNSVKNLNLKNACVLDPDAKKTLSPTDAKFNYFIFGGILGDHPPKKRTKKELTKFVPQFEKRNIGKKQFPTDNAVCVVKKIIEGKSFNELKFKNNHEINLGKLRSVVLPFRYLLKENGEPLISEKIVNHLKKKKSF